jgi:hypothetical protein
MASCFFLKSIKTIPLPLNTQEIIPPPLQQILNHPTSVLAALKPLLTVVLFCMNSNNMKHMTIMKELCFMLCLIIFLIPKYGR